MLLTNEALTSAMHKVIAAHGFEDADTGGHCMAHVKTGKIDGHNAQVMITDADAGLTEWGRDIFIGLYDADAEHTEEFDMCCYQFDQETGRWKAAEGKPHPFMTALVTDLNKIGGQP